jgi:CYTH domain-containing protein
MGRNSEIERKFLVKRLPTPQARGAASRIEQGYFPINSKDFEIRLRRKDSLHLITFKKGRGLSRQEQEIEIPAARFRDLWPLTRAARITKHRYRIPWKKRTIELDVYQGSHRGLVTADVEFQSIRQSRSFHPPEWFGREITGSKRYANRTLARTRRLPQIKNS